MQSTDKPELYDTRDVFLFEQRWLADRRTAAAEATKDEHLELIEDASNLLNQLRIEHNLSDRCVDDVVRFCRELQQRTAVHLKLPPSEFSKHRALPSLALSGWNTKQQANSMSDEVRPV